MAKGDNSNKLRIYEFAKEYGTTSKEVILVLKASGFDVASHMAIITPDMLGVLQEEFGDDSSVLADLNANTKKVSRRFSKDGEDDLSEVKLEESIRWAKKSKVASSTKKYKKMRPPKSVDIISDDDSRDIEKMFLCEPMSVAQFAEKAKLKVGDLILYLLKKNIVATKNQILSQDTIISLGKNFEIDFDVVCKAKKDILADVESSPEKKAEERPPVVVVVGHVDHGKTTLLDFIRKTHVVKKEKGGITQHIGAYEVKTDHGNLVFIDTPGHAAFKQMREHGARLADIAILIIAADDGVKPQTIEAIKQAQLANIPILVAINKIDRAAPSQVESVKSDLAKHGLLVEDWGGQVVAVPISAKVGTGVEDLIEVVLLQAQLMELKASLDVAACGYIVAAKKELGRGTVATVICQHGILRIGDYFIAGNAKGKVNSITDSWGKRVYEAHPGQPVQITGFDKLPQSGDLFRVVSFEEMKRFKYEAPKKESKLLSVDGKEVYNIILRFDGDLTGEALVDALSEINKDAAIPFFVVAKGVGSVTENDVQFAADTGSVIYTLHSKVEPGAAALGVKLGVVIRCFDIIYKLLDDLKLIAERGRPMETVLRKIGEASVIKVFDIKNLGVVAGARVLSGRVTRDSKAKIFRGKAVVGEGKLVSLQREKRSVKEVATGFEFAFMVDGFDGWEIDDRVEFYQEQKVERS